MATIRKRERQDGTRYEAIIRIKRKGELIHRESRTFSREALAKAWGREREVELEKPGALAKAQHGETSLATLIRWYREEFEAVSKWQRSKGAALHFLESTDLAETNALALTPQMVVDHALSRKKGGAGPATVALDLVWIGVVLKAAKGIKGLPVRPEAIEEARVTCKRLGLVGRPRKRARRPTADELRRLDEWFGRKPLEVPMRDLMWFAVHSARRQAEICRIQRSDNDAENLTGLVRDAKHPRKKEGNHRRFKYTREGWAIMDRQPEGDLPFPYNPKSISAAWTRACHMLGILDLTFHDLRHEATSRLFEAGYQIHEVAQFTLHESWTELKRYTQLSPEKLVLR